jgi:hypothetical protein
LQAFTPQVRLQTPIPVNWAGRRRTATQAATLDVRKIHYYPNRRPSAFQENCQVQTGPSRASRLAQTLRLALSDVRDRLPASAAVISKTSAASPLNGSGQRHHTRRLERSQGSSTSQPISTADVTAARAAAAHCKSASLLLAPRGTTTRAKPTSTANRPIS